MSKYAAVASAFALATAGLTVPNQASSQTFTPDFPPYVTLSGYLTISESTVVSCYVTLNAMVNYGGSSMTITGGSFAPGDWQCGWLMQPVAFPWTVTPTSPGWVSISGVALITILGACAGTAHVRWVNGSTWPSTVDFSPASLPGVPAICSLNGSLTVSGGVTLQ
ncbi:hypothetical protein AS593_00665 [Caulobacter vibrioides]|nr:hypothetical protein AS593_00665 [Caulobacter vibrioides]